MSNKRIIAPSEFKTFLLKNNFVQMSDNKHVKFLKEIFYIQKNDQIIILEKVEKDYKIFFINMVVNFHRSKGQGISKDAIKELCKKMNIEQSLFWKNFTKKWVIDNDLDIIKNLGQNNEQQNK